MSMPSPIQNDFQNLKGFRGTLCREQEGQGHSLGVDGIYSWFWVGRVEVGHTIERQEHTPWLNISKTIGETKKHLSTIVARSSKCRWDAFVWAACFSSSWKW